MKVLKTPLEGVLLIEPPTIFEDFRGEYIEIYNRIIYHANGIVQEFIQDDVSISSRNVLRGIHGDNETWKLVSCLYGKVYLVVVNNDEESSQYRKWNSFILSDMSHLQVLIPPKFGTSYLVVSDKVIFHYKQTTTYDRTEQFTLKWDDPELGIWWPIKDPILTKRDSS